MDTSGGRDPGQRRRTGSERDRLGFDENRDRLGSVLGSIVPPTLANRMVAIDLAVEERTYGVGERVPFTVTIRNRLPVPIVVETTEQRPWCWSVDGQLEAREDARLESSGTNSLTFRRGERKRISRVWNGRFRQTDGTRTRWVPASPGPHELRVFLTTPGRPGDEVTIEITR